MTHPVMLSTGVSLNLSLPQAEQLCQLLQMCSLSGQDDPVLHEFGERLADAHVIARWLGENVRIDIPSEQADAALHALQVHSNQACISLVDDVVRQLGLRRA